MVLSLNRRGRRKVREGRVKEARHQSRGFDFKFIAHGGNLDGDGTDSSMLGISPHSFEVLVESKKKKNRVMLDERNVAEVLLDNAKNFFLGSSSSMQTFIGRRVCVRRTDSQNPSPQHGEVLRVRKMPDSSGVQLLILYDNVSYPQRDTSKHAEHWISPSDERFRISFDSKPEI